MRALLLVLGLALAGCTSTTPDVAGEGQADNPCDGVAAPDAPAGLHTVVGPGPGMTTALWEPVVADPPVVSYVMYRDGKAFPLGNSLAFGDHGSASYEVAAVNACGIEGPTSSAVTGTPLPGGELLEAPTVPLGSADGSAMREYPTFNATGALLGNATWRVVTGTGNCCENYVITTHTGRIVDFGGTFLHYSDDEGETWRTVQTPIPYLTGEGAVVTGPQGDILAVGWSPYTGDQLWAHKYVAADDQWYYQTMPIHQPFYDRAWTTVLKGPFEIDGRIAPYVVLVESNFHGSGMSTLLLRSLDGLHYAEVTDSALSIGVESTTTVPEWGGDPDMDWMHPISQSPSRPLTHGLGLQQGGSMALPGACTWRLVHEDGAHSCPGEPLADLPRNQPLYVDGAGNAHHFVVGRDAFTYRMLPAGPASDWIEQSFPLPENATMRVHDQKVNAALDTAVFAMHVNLQGGNTADYLYRFANVTTHPTLEKVMQVGGADSGSDSGLGGERRFDFMTVGMLPDGRAVLSFTDEEFHPPALAIEQA